MPNKETLSDLLIADLQRQLDEARAHRNALAALVGAYRGLVGNTGYVADREMARILWERSEPILRELGLLR